jgi:hypothetical protein
MLHVFGVNILRASLSVTECIVEGPEGNVHEEECAVGSFGTHDIHGREYFVSRMERPLESFC